MFGIATKENVSNESCIKMAKLYHSFSEDDQIAMDEQLFVLSGNLILRGIYKFEDIITVISSFCLDRMTEGDNYYEEKLKKLKRITPPEYKDYVVDGTIVLKAVSKIQS